MITRPTDRPNNLKCLKWNNPVAVSVQIQNGKRESGRTRTVYDIHRYLHDGRYPDGYADEMRRDLEQCFEDEKLTPFPPAKRPVQKCREKHAFIHVYCICGLPESYDTHMFECQQCKKWFHFKCMKLVTEPDSLVCPQCA